MKNNTLKQNGSLTISLSKFYCVVLKYLPIQNILYAKGVSIFKFCQPMVLVHKVIKKERQIRKDKYLQIFIFISFKIKRAVLNTNISKI